MLDVNKNKTKINFKDNFGKEISNLKYLEQIDESIEQIKQGKTVIKSFEELEKMENS